MELEKIKRKRDIAFKIKRRTLEEIADSWAAAKKRGFILELNPEDVVNDYIRILEEEGREIPKKVTFGLLNGKDAMILPMIYARVIRKLGQKYPNLLLTNGDVRVVNRQDYYLSEPIKDLLEEVLQEAEK